MKTRSKTYSIVAAAMMAALTYIATSVIHIQTVTGGYVHIGDSMVILSGILLGPFYGGLAAGIGSMLADLLSGAAMWVPGTFVIKLLAAIAAWKVFSVARNRAEAGIKKALHTTRTMVLAGLAAEVVVFAGYFVYDIFAISLFNGSFTAAGLSSALALKIAETPEGLFQYIAGIVIATLLSPVFLRLRAKYFQSAVAKG